MPSIDFARWTTTLTASYLAITAALIAILGTAVPGRVGLVAVHLTLSGSLVILNRARPSAGILRGIRDWHPLRAVSLPLQGSGAAGAGSWRLAIDCGDSGLGVGVVLRAAEPVSQRTAAVRAAVRVPAFLLPVLCHCHSISGCVLVQSAGGWRPSASCCCCSRRCCWGATCSSSCCRWTARTTCRRAWDRRSPATSSSISFIRYRRAAARAVAHFPARTSRVRSSCAWSRGGTSAGSRTCSFPFTWSVMIATVYGRFHYVLRHARRRGPRDRRRGGVSISRAQ